jgi:hypothetical protein
MTRACRSFSTLMWLKPPGIGFTKQTSSVRNQEPSDMLWTSLLDNTIVLLVYFKAHRESPLLGHDSLTRGVSNVSGITICCSLRSSSFFLYQQGALSDAKSGSVPYPASKVSRSFLLQKHHTTPGFLAPSCWAAKYAAT